MKVISIAPFLVFFTDAVAPTGQQQLMHDSHIQEKSISALGVTHQGKVQQINAEKKPLMRAVHSDDVSDVKLEDHHEESAPTHHQDYAVNHGSDLLETDSEFLPALGLNNPSDLAYRAMDLLMGISSIIPEDYPFVCICLDTGKCQENLPEDKKSQCPNRIGQKASAVRTPFSVAVLLVVSFAGILVNN
mmetsp:Transcript_105705/g.166911  ORF Transcript_105705/g.166911 Transcript_105705/m.166911 type:complete len:189 (-) Transcript_105705:114-680(-)